ncbi:MAG TPA: MarR family transcriptional regulator [Dehalococcoidia bacterium]|jgi:DNA-binding MarR family transcriptional regulator|nr:MarR family transcriptional regulator [Dehalococcoidia bacterium]HIK89731.1 MarR family transcriptional regulator [Dehalococcoidia bacterium]
MMSNSSDERNGLITDLKNLTENMRPPWNKGANRLMDLDLTIPQLKVMYLIADLKTAQMNVIAREMDITVSTCTHLIDKLVASGHVVRGQDPDDRRVVLCSLSDSGIESLDKLQQDMPFAKDEFTSRLSVEELKIFVDAITIMQRVMTEINS